MTSPIKTTTKTRVMIELGEALAATVRVEELKRSVPWESIDRAGKRDIDVFHYFPV
ncbi:hypothetical protein GCM10023155_23890 [Bremerella cremea]